MMGFLMVKVQGTMEAQRQGGPKIWLSKQIPQRKTGKSWIRRSQKRILHWEEHVWKTSVRENARRLSEIGSLGWQRWLKQ
jgi:hypothetical protein